MAARGAQVAWFGLRAAHGSRLNGS